jgi:hypothetical protein
MAELHQGNHMARKFEIHLDAVIVIVVLFAAAVAFIGFQRYQYSVLLQDNIQRQLKQLSLEMEITRLEVLVKRATNADPDNLKGGESEHSR